MENYQVLHLIGEGCFGKVFKGRRKFTGQAVALKFISTRGKSEKDLKNLRQEMAILKTLNHENIILLLDAFETSSDFVVVTEYAHGELFEVFQDDRQLPESEVQKIAKQLVQALYYLHSNRVIHRDMKPQNILIGSNNVIKLCDFGFARSMSNQTVVLNSVKGTPLYMAPELVQEKPYNHTADIWSLGVILYELFVGKPPFYTNSLYSLINLIINDSVKYPDSMSSDFKSFLQGLLQKNPTQRLSWPSLLHHPFVASPTVLAPVVSSSVASSVTTPRCDEDLFRQMERNDPSCLDLAIQTLETAAVKPHLKKLPAAIKFIHTQLSNDNPPEILRIRSAELCRILIALSTHESISLLCVWMRFVKDAATIGMCLPIVVELLHTPKNPNRGEIFNFLKNISPLNIQKNLIRKLFGVILSGWQGDELPVVLSLCNQGEEKEDFLFVLRQFPERELFFVKFCVKNDPDLKLVCGTTQSRLILESVKNPLAGESAGWFNVLAESLCNISEKKFPVWLNFSVVCDLADRVELCASPVLCVAMTRLFVAIIRLSAFGNIQPVAQRVLKRISVYIQDLCRTNETIDEILFLGNFCHEEERLFGLLRAEISMRGIVGKCLHIQGVKELVQYPLKFGELLAVLQAVVEWERKLPNFAVTSGIFETLINKLDEQTGVSAEKGLITNLVATHTLFPPTVGFMSVLAQLVQSTSACAEFVACGGLSMMRTHNVFSSECAESSLTVLSNVARSSPEIYPSIHEDLGPYAELASLVRDSSPTVVAKACSAVGNMCRHSAYFYEHLLNVIPGLVTVLESFDVNCRKFASFAIGNIAFHSSVLYANLRVAVAPLVTLLDDEDEKTRANAAGALGNLVRNSPILVDTMITCGVLEGLIRRLPAQIDSSGRIALFSLGNLAMHKSSRDLLNTKFQCAKIATRILKNADTQTAKYCQRLCQKLAQH